MQCQYICATLSVFDVAEDVLLKPHGLLSVQVIHEIGHLAVEIPSMHKIMHALLVWFFAGTFQVA
jgi:hypothetical protein